MDKTKRREGSRKKRKKERKIERASEKEESSLKEKERLFVCLLPQIVRTHTINTYM